MGQLSSGKTGCITQHEQDCWKGLLYQDCRRLGFTSSTAPPSLKLPTPSLLVH